jgi:hypothetical protein
MAETNRWAARPNFGQGRETQLPRLPHDTVETAAQQQKAAAAAYS